MIKIKELSPEQRENLRFILEARCLNGSCHLFAIALHRGLGWPMVALLKENEFCHAFVIDDESRPWDARGLLTNEELGRPFGVSLPYNLLEISEDYISKIPGVHLDEIDINSILGKAQAVWPELPWKENTPRTKTIIFSEALEGLSRACKRWLYASSGGALEIAEGNEGEVGYELTVNLDGTYAIGRLFELEQEEG